MKHYETLMLVKTESTGDELAFLEDSIEKKIVEAGGKVNLFDKWGKIRLAYPVQKADYGVYILSRYSVPRDTAKTFVRELERFFQIKCHDVVMRAVSVSLADEGTAEYKHPDPVDASPSRRNVSDFGQARPADAAEKAVASPAPAAKTTDVASDEKPEAAAPAADKADVPAPTEEGGEA